MATKIAVVASQDPETPEEGICPVLPVRDMVLFPGIIIPLFVGRPRSIRAMESALLQDKKVFVAAQTDNGTEDPEIGDLYKVGTLCNVLQVVRVPDGTTKVLVEGIARMRVREYRLDKDILTAHVVPMPWIQAESANLEPWRRRVLGSFECYNTLQPRIPNEVMTSILAP